MEVKKKTTRDVGIGEELVSSLCFPEDIQGPPNNFFFLKML